MDKLIFTKTKKYSGQQIVAICPDIHKKVKAISDKTNLSIAYVLNTCIDFALENVEIKDKEV